MQYIKDSLRELRHVVWPTKTETKIFFIQVFWTLTIFTLFLFMLSVIFWNLIDLLKNTLSWFTL